MTSPKTTLCGILTIILAVAHAALQYEQKQPVDMASLAAAMSIAMGLIVAKDGSTHSTQGEVVAATIEQKIEQKAA